MFGSKTYSGYGRQINKLRKIRFLALFFSIILIVSAFFVITIWLKKGRPTEKDALYSAWNEENYEQAFSISKEALEKKPLDYFLLTMNGFSAYQMGISQINAHNTLTYIQNCIMSLRKALLVNNVQNDGRLYYVLGKAYCYKGDEYADLAIKYLELAKKNNFEAEDIPQFLGRSYAVCGDYRGSVEAFSQAFKAGVQPSDTLLLSIARSYINMKDYNMAVGYLLSCINNSSDSKSIIVARYLLAEIYVSSGNYDDAENQYLSIIKDAGESAEVHFQLGELYSLKGETTRARSEWRIAYRQDPAHSKARARLN
jgi:tetratricopeptide (TPR) repeat protein